MLTGWSIECNSRLTVSWIDGVMYAFISKTNCVLALYDDARRAEVCGYSGLSGETKIDLKKRQIGEQIYEMKQSGPLSGYDRKQKYLYGASITEDSLSCTSWIDGKMNIFVSETLYSYVLNDRGRLEKIIDCYDMDMMRNTYEQTRQEVNGVTYKLKKGNIFLPGDYISLVRINGDGSEEVVIRCKHISDGEVIGSTIFSLFIISVILGIISVFVVEFVTWRRDMRAFFAKKRAEGLSEDEIHRQFAEHQREKNERVSSIFRPR